MIEIPQQDSQRPQKNNSSKPNTFKKPQGANNNYRINHQIKHDKVRVFDDEGNQLGILPIREARAAAYDAGLDLVEIAPKADPPVCRITDYGHFKYEQAKKAKAAKKNQQQQETKEVRLSVRIFDHDTEVKAAKAQKFLDGKHLVRVTVLMQRRERSHPELAQTVLERFVTHLTSYRVDREAVLEGAKFGMTLAPEKS